MTTRRSSKPPLAYKKQLETDFSSDDEKPRQRSTRQAYRTFIGTREQERTMLLTALRTELSSKTTKFLKPTLQPHQKNRILRTIQDDDTTFDKIIVQAARAFSITWIKQTAPGKLEYKPQILSKYAHNKPTTAKNLKTAPSPLSGRKPKPKVTTVEEDASDESDSQSENLLEEEDFTKTDEESINTPTLTQTPTHSNTSDDRKMPARKRPPSPEAPSIEADHEDSSFSYASVTREIEQAGQTLDDATNDSQILDKETPNNWKQELESSLHNQIQTTIATVKDDLLETISTTKGELLTQIDTLRADITAHETRLHRQTTNAEAIYLKLQKQQADMETLSHDIQKQQESLQEYFNIFQQNTTAERKHIQTTREEVRQNFKHDIEQASRHYLVHHEKKSETIMANARAKQTETYRQECRTIQHEYRKKIEAKYDALEAESMQFADQAILDLGDLLHQEKNNLLDEVKQDLPETLKQTITSDLEPTIATHMDAIKEQRKTTITQIQKTAKRHTEQMEVQQQAMSDAIDAIKTKASTAFSIELQTKVQQQILDINHLIASKTTPLSTPPAQKRKSHVPLTSNYWAETTKHTTTPLPAHSNPDTAPPQLTDRLKLARSKDLESKLPKFRKDQMYIHLPNEPLQHYMEAFYETLATIMNNYDFPIVLLQDLAPRGTTCPTEAYMTYEHETLMKISRALYQKLLGVIPHTCTILQNLLANHAATQDGYKALYAMMRIKCTYLQDLLPTWGPAWQTGTTAFEYVSSIHSYLTQERRRNKYYTEFEVAAEMIQQAKRHPEYQLLAGAYMAQIIAMPTDQNEMAPEFHTDNLALNFESNKQLLTLPNNPVVNKFGQPRKEGSNDREGGRRQHQYKNPVQCASCKLFGHCIDTQVCRFSAQLMYAKDYTTANADKAKTNAEAYNAANNKTKVNKIYQQFPEKFDESMTEEEREITRYELASTFYNQDDNNDDS
jgi:hypothetical protein